ncbi:MAG TPA: winged helix-turn-helix transcriptional regulator [Mycobacteriales bacterium]|nr:winged helix-turn-helix transcriptional regulator [Mycobacteriales bacterium]
MSDAAPAALSDLIALLGRRHALTIAWGLRGGPQPFGVLVATTGSPEAQVSQVVRSLREAGIVEVDESGDYRLTSAGRRMQGVLEPLADWAERDWASLSPRQRSPRGAATRGRGEPD